MNEVELVLVNDTDKCTVYTIQFLEESRRNMSAFTQNSSKTLS